MAAFFDALWTWIVNFVQGYHWFNDTLDILVIAFAIYWLIKLVRDSRAEQLVKGFFLLAVVYGIAWGLKLTTVKYVLQLIFDNVLILLVVIFQPEIRRALEQVGHTRFSHLKIFGMNDEESEAYITRWKTAIGAICGGVGILQRQKMGALIVLERHTRLNEFAKSGTVLNADPTTELIGNIFFNKAPLHDGATIIREGKIYAAGCILPLTENISISRALGTRHRAGVGMSENSDAIVVIVSEETGGISIACGGELKQGYTADSLKIELENRILWSNVRTDAAPEKVSTVSKIRRWFSK